MSLINEALKKAQRQRALDSAPLSSAPSGVAAAAVTTHVRVASHKRSHAALWFGLGLVALGAGATALVMHYSFDSATPETAKVAHTAPPPAVAPAPAPSAPAPAPATVSSAPAAAEPEAPLVMLPPIAPPTPAPAPATAAESPPSPAPSEAAVPEPVAPVPVAPIAAPPTPAEREAQVYSFLNTIRLSGVRGLDREARVLMNERVWRLNDIVSPELGLRLSAVRANLLVFTDAQGKTYEKPY